MAGRSLNRLARDIHRRNIDAGWWHDIETGDRLERNCGELLMLVVTEISEAMEGVRKSSQDNHLPHRSTEEVGLAKALIRIFDYAGARNLDLGGALAEKLEYNAAREDHKPENRIKPGGKKI